MNMVGVWLLITLPALLLGGPALSLEEDSPIVTDEMVSYINSKGKWVASKDWVGDMTRAEARRYVSSGKSSEDIFPEEKFGALMEHLTVPAAFDARLGWPECVGHTIRTQGYCGSSWAIAATDVVADRHCIYNGSGVRTSLSPQYLLSCNTYGNSCSYYNDAYTWKFMYSSYNALDSCFPYTTGTSGSVPACSAGNGCSLYDYVYSIYTYTSPSAIQTAILAQGPVQSTMYVYTDFYSYQSGIYSYQYGSFEGYQAVKIVGWGSLGGVNYWIVANSWGPDWGQFGFFNIAFGQCYIDSDAIAANVY